MVTPKKSAGARAKSKSATAKSTAAKSTVERTAASKAPATRRDKVQGEGDYASAREFNKDERAFVESHDTEDLARRAAPENASAATEMDNAERKGKSHAKPDPESDDASDRADEDDDPAESGRS